MNSDGTAERKSEREATGRGYNLVLWACGVAAVVLIAVGLYAYDEMEARPDSAVRFGEVGAQTARYHAYYKTISLDAEQQRVFREALSSLPAPCCNDKTAYTCCCKCNMARSWWGLAKHAIVNEGYGVDEVRAVVEDWFEHINPSGFTGDACYTGGGCSRPFHRNGCGGMNEAHVVL